MAKYGVCPYATALSNKSCISKNGVFEAETAEFKSIVTTNFRDSVSVAAFTADNKKMYVISNRGRNPRVVKAESDQMVEALKKRGVDVDYMVKDNEGHGFRNQENQFEFYGAMEKFLAKHLQKG